METSFDFSFFDHFMDAVLVTHPDGKLCYCNEAFMRIFELSPRKTKQGIEVLKNLPIDIEGGHSKNLNDILQVASPYREISFNNSAGEENRISVSLRAFKLANQTYVLYYIKDVSLENRLQQKYKAELKNREDYILKLDRKLKETSFMHRITSLALQHETDAIVLLDCIFTEIIENFDYIELCLCLKYDASKDAYVNDFYKSADTFKHDVSRQIMRETEALKDQLKASEDSAKLRFMKIPSGTIAVVMVKGRLTEFGMFVLYGSQLLQEKMSEDAQLITSASDQYGLSAENSMLYVRSMTDELTKLYNNRYFKYRFETEMARHKRKELQFGIIMLDVDHFKKFNDTYGHATGDLVLQYIAEQMKSACRATDILARLGGEEFAVILVETDREGAMIAAERLRKKIETSVVNSSEHGNLKVTASLGVSLYPGHGTNYEELLEAADKALYFAKGSGRNRSEFYQLGMEMKKEPKQKSS